MDIEVEERGSFTWTCECGCEQDFRGLRGLIRTGASKALFYVMFCPENHGARNVYTSFGVGGWPGKTGDSFWTSTVSWHHEGNVISRVIDPKETPISKQKSFVSGELGEMLLRDDVMTHDGAKAWLFRTLDALVAECEAVQTYLTPD